MTTWNLRLYPITRRLRHITVAVACLAAFFTCAQSARADVTAVVKEGTLEITRDLGTTGEGDFGLTITLAGRIDEDIRVSVNGELIGDPISRNGVSKIDIFADQSLVTFGVFDFDGDIGVEVLTGGRCELGGLNLQGDLLLSGSAGRIFVSYERGEPIIDGNVTLDGGPGSDLFGKPSFSGGALFVSGDLTIDGGPGNDTVNLEDAIILGNTCIDLGQSTGGGPSSFDADSCGFRFCQFFGSVMILGDEGADDLFVSFSTIDGNLMVDMGNGKDRVGFFFLSIADDSTLLLAGGNGNSDELNLNGFPILSNEHSGFETVNE